MSYTAGNLDLQLTAISSEAVSSLDTVINKLSSLSSVLHSVTTTDMKWINSFGTKMKNLSKKMTDIDWSTIDAGFNRLTVSITPFINKVATAETSLKSLNEMLTKVSGKKLNISSNGLGKLNFGRIFNLAMIRRFATYMANVVQYGTNFTETLNLWQVAMRENLDQADEFIKKMNKAYSISQQTLMNAQAIFKNMIGSLGNISDTVAYQLSEAIVQMAGDFSSLYNVTFEQAITKFQATLAGQVRPIRSVSGYDIVESTLYQVYQGLGGTKSVRQLNRTEKQLLSIYAVFQQMQRSGAVGDLSKTLDNFANQSRMMTENFKELQTYVGLFFQDLLQSWGVMKYINATLIFLTEIVKTLTKYEAPNFIEGMFESVTDTTNAVEELQGKLLDFDKFRALDSSAGSELAIDQTIVDAVSQYQSVLENVNNEARNIAKSWLDALGLSDMTEEKLQKIRQTLSDIVLWIGFALGASVITSIGKVAKSLGLVGSSLGKVALFATAAFTAFKLFDALLSNLDGTARTVVGALSIVAGMIGLVLGLVLSLKEGLKFGLAGAIAAGLGVGAIIAGIKAVATKNAQIEYHALGASDIDSGTLFVAGEAGKTEAVYTGTNGKTNVANVQQMKAAFYQALVEYGQSHQSNQPIVVTLDGEVVYRSTTAHAKRRGEHWAK